MAHSLSLTILENIHIELLSAITVLFAWTKIPLPTMWKITVKKGSGKSAPFPGLNLSADSSCMCHRNDLLESDTTDYYVLEARPSIWHYVGIFLVVSSIYHDWKIWKHLRYLKHSMVSRSLFVNVVADILANHNREYLYGFKEFYLYFFKNLSDEVYLSCLDFAKTTCIFTISTITS